MHKQYECRVVSGDLEGKVNRMAKADWRFDSPGHYEPSPYTVFERRLSGKNEVRE